MREPFSRVLRRGEVLRAAGECDLAQRAGPLAGLFDLLLVFSPILSLLFAIRLDGWQAKLLGVLAPPLLAALLARGPTRGLLRPRQWIGVTDRRLLIWRRAGAVRPAPRIEAIPLDSITGVELVQDRWDRRHSTHQIVLEMGQRHRSLERTHNATALRDAIAPSPPPPAPPPPPADFRPSDAATR